MYNDKTYFLGLLKNELVKNDVTVKAIFIAVLSFILPLLQFIVFIAVLVFIDFITGIMQAKQLGEPIESSKMRRSLWKMTGYILAIISFNVLNVLAPIIDWVKIACGFIAVIEMYSIGENLSTNTGFNYVKVILKFVASKFSDGSKTFSEIESEVNKEKEKLKKNLKK